METYTLTTGRSVPAIGFGTWKITPDSEAKRCVTEALKAGYRVIDTAKIYGNERGVGEAIRESDIPRDELFVTTKLWNDDQGRHSTIKACQASLDRLGLDYVDLYLIHWPASKRRFASWQDMAELLKQGKIKAAGVSNFTVEHLQELQAMSGLEPAVNQVEFHPYIYEQQNELLSYCKQQNILVEAYSPLSRLGDANTDTIKEIAGRINKTVQQVVLRWCIQHGTLPLPRSTNAEHIQHNFEVFDFQLSDKHMQTLNGLSDGERVTWDPAGMGN
nr:Aldo/keto reductase family [uncultured bacterium]